MNRHAVICAGLLAAAAASPALAQSQAYGSKPASAPGGYMPPAPYKPAHIAGGYGERDTNVSDIPPNAHAGQCFTRLVIPPKTEAVTEKVVERVEHTDIRVIPAVYGWEEKKVKVKDECVESVLVPATYKWITETVTVRPETTRIETRPAIYETKTEKVLIRAEEQVWQKGVALKTNIGYQTRVTPTGDILCLVTRPAQYDTISRRVLVKAAESVEIKIPAVTREFRRQVVDTPARMDQHTIPAVYETIKVRTVVQPERTETITIPATYKTVTTYKQIADGRVEWAEIICHTNSNPGVIRAVQVALTKRGYYAGKPTGVFDSRSQYALAKFQADNNLPVGELTIRTADALGVTH